jgi:hypothetical protein
VTGLDRSTILEAVMPSLLTVEIDAADDGEVGAARVVAEGPGVVAGLPVAKEVFGRLGVRTRSLVPDGAEVAPGLAVAEVGGALAAIRGAGPIALTWVTQLSAVATGAVPPAEGDPLHAYAAGLSRSDAVRDAGPSFRLEFED